MRYAVVIERGPRNYSAYIPDVEGCVAAGKTVQETLDLLREALRMHFEAMRDDGELIPDPVSLCDYVDVDIPARRQTA
jgi:predicted RNase H-like HicB family nuclease